jgi:ribosomal-protein-alanine N-acetyltransferase
VANIQSLAAVSARAAMLRPRAAASWAVTDAHGVVGRVGFRALDLATGSGEVTYWMLPAARGRNIAARALTAASDWMFATAGFHRLALLHSTRNDPSCRVAEKAGYAYEGTARSQGLHLDGWHDMHVHARTN